MLFCGKNILSDSNLFFNLCLFRQSTTFDYNSGLLKQNNNGSIILFHYTQGKVKIQQFSDTEDFYSCFHLCEDTRHTLYTDKIEFHVLEFPKLPKELKEDSSDMLLWAKFISAEKKEEFDMLAEKNPYIQSAYEQLQVISQDKQKRLEYEAREKAIRDYNQLMREATMKGYEQGIQYGIQQKLMSLIEKRIKKNQHLYFMIKRVIFCLQLEVEKIF